MEGTFSLPHLNLTIPMADVYEGISFQALDEDD